MIDIDLHKKIRTYNGYRTLRICTSFVSPGITQIIGPSGAGKTTLLRMVAGLLKPEEGRIRIDGTTWLDTRARIDLPPQQRGVGFVFQDYALFPHMTVEKHLRYGTEDDAYINRLLQIGRMETFRLHKPRQLSGGQQQRLAILRALTTRPKLMLMDEPFSALDPALRTGLIADLKDLLHEQGVTCLVVTHQPFETMGFAGHTYELEG